MRLKVRRNSDLERKVRGILAEIQGFVALYIIHPEDAKIILKHEAEAEKSAFFGNSPIINIGVREALKRRMVYAIAYRPIFFESYTDELHSSPVVMMVGNEIVGEELSYSRRLTALKCRKDVICIGSSFVVYKSKVRGAKGQPRIVLPARNFPQLKDLCEARDVVSGSPSPSVDQFLKLKMGVETKDINVGTVIVGFSLCGD